MMLKVFRVRLIEKDMLRVINKDEWHKDIVAGDMTSAWAKFVKQKMAPVYSFGMCSLPEHYDIRFETFRTI